VKLSAACVAASRTVAHLLFAVPLGFSEDMGRLGLAASLNALIALIPTCSAIPRLQTRLDPPSDLMYNNINTTELVTIGPTPSSYGGRMTTSQRGQDSWVDAILARKRSGFVVESGAFDGKTGSNSLWLEVARGWHCLLVEANPLLQKRIRQLHRKCHLLRGGLSITTSPGTFEFTMAESLGGITSESDDNMKERIKKAGGADGVAMVPCYPLNQVMKAIGRSVVDYWSLDTEGSEVNILNATDFDALEVGLITVEHQRKRRKRQGIRNLLVSRGFKRVRCDNLDDLYASTAYLSKRGIRMPRNPSVLKHCNAFLSD
jgi:hypothetical protein